MQQNRSTDNCRHIKKGKDALNPSRKVNQKGHRLDIEKQLQIGKSVRSSTDPLQAQGGNDGEKEENDREVIERPELS